MKMYIAIQNTTEYDILVIYIWIELQWVVGHNTRNCKLIDNICVHAHAYAHTYADMRDFLWS